MARKDTKLRTAPPQDPHRNDELVAPSEYPLLGALLAGRYLLEEPLGYGGVADVYRAADGMLGRTVAVKVFRSAAGLPLAEQRRFEREGRTMAGLNHGHLVTLHDTGVHDGTAYLVLQYIDGVTLADRLPDGPLPPARVARIGASLADALSYVHAHKVLHRDVKPSNVLLAHDGGVYLTDFGIARMRDGAAITVAGMLVGTAAYLAPEQVDGGGAEPASDVYALGLVLLECLTGQRVYPGSPTEAALARLANPPQVPGDLSPQWRALLTAMTFRDPANRPNARVVAGQLSRLALMDMVDAAVRPAAPAVPAVRAAPAVPAVPPAAPAAALAAPAAASRTLARPPRGPAASRNRSRLAAGVACVALLGGAGVVMLSAGSPPGPATKPPGVRPSAPPGTSGATPQDREPGSGAGAPSSAGGGSGVGSAVPGLATATRASALPLPGVPGGSILPAPPVGAGPVTGPTAGQQPSSGPGTSPGAGPTTSPAPGNQNGNGKPKDKDKDKDKDKNKDQKNKDDKKDKDKNKG